MMPQTKRLAAPHIMFLLLGLFIIDGIVIYGRVYAPEQIGLFACSCISFAKLSAVLIPKRFGEVSLRQCTGPMKEPALSITFLLFKLSFVFFIFLYHCVFTVLKDLNRLEQVAQGYIDQALSFASVVKEQANIAGGMTVVAIAMLYFINPADKPFNTGVFQKIAEDLACVMVFAAYSNCFNSVVVFFLFLRNAKKLSH